MVRVVETFFSLPSRFFSSAALTLDALGRGFPERILLYLLPSLAMVASCFPMPREAGEQLGLTGQGLVMCCK